MKFTKTFTIRQYECGLDLKLSLTSLLNIMQDVAAEHSVLLNVSILDLFNRGLTWMLSRYHISVERYPNYMEKVIIKTWPSTCEGYFTLREYTMESEKGDILARMTSSFVVYDIKAKKIVQVEKHLPIENALIKERAIDDKFPSLQLPEKIDHSEEIFVRKHDIDINRHVNNVAGIEIAIESVPIDILLHYDLSDAQITFKGQAFYGDTLLSQCEVIPEDDEYRILHHVLNKQGNTSILKMVTNWVKKPH